MNKEPRMKRYVRNQIVAYHPTYIYGKVELDYVHRLERELHMILNITKMNTQPHETPYWLVERRKK